MTAISAKPMKGQVSFRPARKNCSADAWRRVTHAETPTSIAKKTRTTT
ncbi:MAG: hypothetical protein ACYTKD_32165 [Planctomycetota bacterium]